MWNQNNSRKKWKQTDRGYIEEDIIEGDNEEIETPRCPYCNHELDYILEKASGSEVVYYEGYYQHNWEDNKFVYYDSGNWESVDSTDWEDEGSGVYLCPHCGRDISHYINGNYEVEYS